VATDFSRLLKVADALPFERHRIGHLLDATGRYEEHLDREFPFVIRLFHFRARRFTQGSTWHERLELFLPLDGRCSQRMGERVVVLEPGDLLVVDNLKLHHVMDAPDLNTRVVVISFLPEFVYSLGSPSHDYAFLLPFYSKLEDRPQVLRRNHPDAGAAYHAVEELLRHYFASQPAPLHQAGCKALLLKFLYKLAQHFESTEVLRGEFLRQQQRTVRLKKLFEHIARHYPEKLSVAGAARLSDMSPPQFMRSFKQVAGMTLVSYLHHVRLSNAARLLRETSLSIAEIASRVGFADQSYFDRRFKKSFGQSPKQFRSGMEKPRRRVRQN
jgi:AraC-like DNA-binding protein